MTTPVGEVRERLAIVRQGGSKSARAKHTARGKLAAAGIVTGIGRVEGREVVVVANDATVKGGT